MNPVKSPPGHLPPSDGTAGSRLAAWQAVLPSVINDPSTSPVGVKVGGRRTTMRLEPEFWQGLQRMSEIEGVEVAYILTLIDNFRAEDITLSSAVRIAVLSYFRMADAENPRSHLDRLRSLDPAGARVFEEAISARLQQLEARRA